MRLNKEYMGTVELSPEKPVIAGEFSTWTITFTAGEYGIDDGGSLVIAWKSVSDWDTPQFDEKVEPGFTTVTTTGDCLVKARYNKFVRSFGNSILIDVYRGFIKKGDKITVTLGDTSQGSLGMRAQSFCEREHEFRVFLDPCGTNRYEEMPQRLKVQILPSYHHEIQAIVPATVKIGEPFEVAVRALDEFGNPTDKYIGDVELAVRGVKAHGLPASVHFDGSSSNALKIPGCIIDETGFGICRLKIVSMAILRTAMPLRQKLNLKNFCIGEICMGKHARLLAQACWKTIILFLEIRLVFSLQAGRAMTLKYRMKLGLISVISLKNLTKRANFSYI